MRYESSIRPFFRGLTRISRAVLCSAFVLLPALNAQITNTLFFEDFDDNIIDPLQLVPDSPFFEGGVGNIAATATGGAVEFTGTVSQQWWAGATLRVVPTFEVSDAKQIAVEVDRVVEGGVGTASRSALWIMDSTQTRYVLFADVRGEGGWSFNRKIGIAGDNPTGGGTQMAAFDDSDDGGLHVMKAVADGQNVRIYLDDRLGATVRFPYTNLVFHIGSYARANGDSASTRFDNLEVYSIGTATFQPTNLTVSAGQTLVGIVVSIPEGLNATTAVELRVVSSNPALVNPVGGVNGTLTLNFAAGASNSQTINVESLGGLGGATLTLQNDIGLTAGNALSVTVISGPGIRLEDNFAGAALDPAKWERNDTGFEPSGSGLYEIVQADGRLTISGEAFTDFWGGTSVRSVPTFTATRDLPLTVEVDRVSINRTKLDETESTAARSSLWLATANRSQYFMFAQNLGENGWQVNVNSTGVGTDLSAFSGLDLSTSLHRMKLVADGQGVDVYLDDQFGGRFDFPVSSGLHVELGGYTRAALDVMNAAFDNLKVENTLPCITTSPVDVPLNLGQNTETVAVTIPRLLNAGGPASITVTSRNPNVAIPQGAVGGVLTLNYAAGGTNRQSFTVQTVGLGSTVFDIASADVCVANSVAVAVTAAPVLVFADDFSGANGAALSNKWVVEATSLQGDGGSATFDSGVTISNNSAAVLVTGELATWPGFSVFTTDSFDASVTQPAIFEIDREKLAFTLVTGTSAKQRAGIWITDESRTRYVFFTEYATHDGAAGGWQYHRSIGETTDNPVTAAGISIAAFADAQFNDRGAHRMRAVANGSTVKLYLDGVLGADVPFPVAQGIVFGFGTYVMAATDVSFGLFDDANVYGVISGGTGGPTLSVARQSNGDITISWDAPGTLQSSETLAPESWTIVTPAPAGTTYTIPAASQGTHRFFRVVQ
jgi:hypothetical protein